MPGPQKNNAINGRALRLGKLAGKSWRPVQSILPREVPSVGEGEKFNLFVKDLLKKLEATQHQVGELQQLLYRINPEGGGTLPTVNVNSTTTGVPGTSASVTNIGTPTEVLLDFVIPRGDKGDKGDAGSGGGSLVTPPETNTSAGVPLQVAYAAPFLFFCVGTNSWRKILTRDVKETFTYTSDGDANGLFYWLGTNKGLHVWTNPATLGTLLITASTTMLAGTAFVVNRQAEDNYVSPQAGSWIKFDLLTEKLRLTAISFRQRSFAKIDANADFRIEGSNNGTDWTVLWYEPGTKVPATPNTWAFWPVTGQSVYYRYFRISQPGSNSYFCIGELELYGDLA